MKYYLIMMQLEARSAEHGISAKTNQKIVLTDSSSHDSSSWIEMVRS